jgi:hypothetical protein
VPVPFPFARLNALQEASKHSHIPGNQTFINPQSVVGNQPQGNQPEIRAINPTISQFILGN